MSSNNSNSLRPAWNRGNSKGFQPPPQVEQQQQQQQRNASKAEEKQRDYNKFSALDDDDDNIALTAATAASSSSSPDTKTAAAVLATETTTNSRSEALRPRTASFGGSKPVGRSLADLAARAPERTGSRFSNLRAASTTESGVVVGAAGVETQPPPPPVEEKVIRFTRERLLSMRPPPLPTARDKLLEELEGSSILSEAAQDPVCWDNLDADEIWATVPRRAAKTAAEEPVVGVRRASSTSAPIPSLLLSSSSGLRREASTTSGGRWQRGVALPPEGSKQRSSNRDAEDPDELWDDPVGVNEGAAMDFSAFGTMPDDENEAVFDFEKMAEASKRLEEEMHGRSRASSNATAEDSTIDNALVPGKVVNPNRPLATVGTTIRSGSGDNVNVFEDFDDPAGLAAATAAAAAAAAGESAAAGEPTIKAATEDPTASSRLMAMIGVKKDESAVPDAKLTAWGDAPAAPLDATASALAGIPLNPWGSPILGGGPNNNHQQQQQQPHGLDLQARLRRAELEQQKVGEENRRRLEHEEAQQRRQQEQERARTLQQQQQQQQAGVQSQVEVVLMERISTILENSWGRSDLVSILATLHAEDSRVIPLLNNADALRALLLRNPRRVAVVQDPALRAEMAALLVTNAQWQQQQQQQGQQQQQQLAMQQQQKQQQAMQQQEELERRALQLRRDEEQVAAARAQQQIIPDAPWFYSDPSNNIQGPFRGEEMRQWLEAGYFKGDLPISQNPSGPFRALSLIFTDLSVAFMIPEGPSEAEARANAEEQQRRELAERARVESEAAKREKIREEQLRRQRNELGANERLAREEQLRAQAKASDSAAKEKSANSNGGNESSAQLKLMLGLGAQGVGVDQNVETHPSSNKAAAKTSSQQKSPNDSSASFDAATTATKNAAPAWGGAAVSQPAAKKTMSEIQNEEARAAAIAAMNQQGSRSSSSGWANVAAARGGSTAWSGGAAKQQPAAVLSNAIGRPGGPARTMSLQPPNSSAANIDGGGPLPRSNSFSKADADAFGAKMLPTLEKWCKDQMIKLNGTDDLTLVEFCMTLADAEEIRQYLAAYLGSTPQVHSFATEFINRKGGARDKVDEWESTVTVKKGRKKKAGAH